MRTKVGFLEGQEREREKYVTVTTRPRIPTWFRRRGGETTEILFGIASVFLSWQVRNPRLFFFF